MSIRMPVLAAFVVASFILPALAQPTAQAPAPPAMPPAAAQPASGAAPTFTVVIEHYGFNPKRIVVPQGATVTWTNRDGVRHNATIIGQWTTGTILSGQTGSITAAKAGTFEYKCTVHPDMHGTLVVEAPK